MAARLAQPSYDALAQAARASEVQHVDETGRFQHQPAQFLKYWGRFIGLIVLLIADAPDGH